MHYHHNHNLDDIHYDTSCHDNYPAHHHTWAGNHHFDTVDDHDAGGADDHNVTIGVDHDHPGYDYHFS